MTSERIDDYVQDVFSNLMMRVNTCIPGQIVSYDRTSQTAEIQPVLKIKFVEKDPENLPIIKDVPVVYPGSGGYWLTFDLVPGDYVLLLFSQRSIGAWQTQGGIVDPSRRRKFHMSDAIALPGINPNPDVLSGLESGGMSIQNRDGSKYIKIKSTGQVNINGNLTVDP